MRRAILLIPLTLSPVYAIGFWGSLGGGLNLGGFGESVDKRYRYIYYIWDTVIGASPKGFIAGMNLMGGISLQPIPIAVGLGVDYYAGTQRYGFDVWGPKMEDTFEVKRTYIKLPVAYQLSLPLLKGYFGLYPAYALYSVKGMMEDTTRIDFKGLAFGGFVNLYFFLGFTGLGGGIFFDYGPSFKESVMHINNVLYLGINLGLLVSLGVLE
jgi:hypothetical protein